MKQIFHCRVYMKEKVTLPPLPPAISPMTFTYRKNSQTECPEVTAQCSSCVDTSIPVERGSTMVHCSRKKVKIVCQKNGVKYRRNFKTANHERNNLAQFYLRLVKCDSP